MPRVARIALSSLAAACLACGSDSSGPSVPGPDRIAFVEAVVAQPATFVERHVGSQLSVVSRDGTDHHTLTPSSSWVASFDWAARAGRVAYRTTPTDPYVQVIADDGTAITQIDTRGALSGGAFDLSPDGTQLLYVSGAPDGVRLWVAQVNSGQKRELVRDDYGIGGGIWSPDGRWIAFAQRDTLWKIQADGTARTRIAALRSVEEIAWSPDGSMLAMHGPGGVWVMRTDGSNARQLTGEGKPTPGFTYPRWSPDGRRLLGRIYVYGDWQILVVRVSDGVTETRLSGAASEGDWSPDGSRFVYVKLSGRQLVTVRVDGTGEEAMRSGPIGDPYWLR